MAYFYYFPQKLLIFLKNNLISLKNLQKLEYNITGIEWDIYFEKKKGFSVFATILDAILDFSAHHQLCQFMPAVSETA